MQSSQMLISEDKTTVAGAKRAFKMPVPAFDLGVVILKAIFCLLPPRRVFSFREDPVNLIINRLTGLFLSANEPLKRKSTSENPHQSAPIRIPSSRLRNQNIWALGIA
jgi:hypothetical protein